LWRGGLAHGAMVRDFCDLSNTKSNFVCFLFDVGTMIRSRSNAKKLAEFPATYTKTAGK
jgi:hypothetical protein